MKFDTEKWKATSNTQVFIWKMFNWLLSAKTAPVCRQQTKKGARIAKFSPVFTACCKYAAKNVAFFKCVHLDGTQTGWCQRAEPTPDWGDWSLT